MDALLNLMAVIMIRVFECGCAGTASHYGQF